MFCMKCGATLEDGSAFCTSCGARVDPEAPAPEVPAASPGGQPCDGGTTQTIPRCPSCGAVLEPGSAFCTSCGAAVPTGGAGTTWAGAGAGATVAGGFGNQADSPRCPSCGAMLEPGSAFCTSCGAAVAGAGGGGAVGFNSVTTGGSGAQDGSGTKGGSGKKIALVIVAVVLAGVLVGGGVAVASHFLFSDDEETEETVSDTDAEGEAAATDDDADADSDTDADGSTSESSDSTSDDADAAAAAAEAEAEAEAQAQAEAEAEAEEEALIYESLLEFYQDLIDLDADVHEAASTFNTSYGSSKLSKAKRKSLAADAEDLLDEIEDAADALDELDVPASSVNRNAYKNLKLLYSYLETRIDIVCQGWDLSFRYSNNSSTACSDAVTDLMEELGSHDYNVAFHDYMGNDSYYTDAGFKMDKTGENIGLVDPSS